ncbi:alpha/beta fold hydrolase [Streptomyces sp. NPDC002659]|uniref:alpha/beta fold hydrolase n=1 Tax=Streptomyces sp. NPDC002659 TaxID=3364656 RepID=UPI0036B02D0A
MPILFIHGITVRQERFEHLLGDVRAGFDEVTDARIPVNGCYWGDLGRSGSYDGRSIPGFTVGARELGDEVSPYSHPGLLAVLLEDPSAELAGLRDVKNIGDDAPGFMPLPDGVEQRNLTLQAAEGPVISRVTAETSSFSGPFSTLDDDQVGAVVGAAFGGARGADRELDVKSLCSPVARAITAGLYRETVGEDLLGDGFRWNRAVDAVEAALDEELGGERGMVKDMATRSLSHALRKGLRNRLMPGISLFLGDVFAWFHNRTTILDRVDQAVRDAGSDGPLILVGHSLGGVIALEYSLQCERDVELLGTVGSQVGLFAELGVLRETTQEADGKLAAPACVAAWHNVYDPDDALSFLAAPVFSSVSDIETENDAPFPAAHSEYWNLSGTYKKLMEGAMR